MDEFVEDLKSKKKLRFVHVPKTGGSNLISSIPKIKYVGHYEKVTPDCNCVTIAVVRNPFDWLVSMYMHSTDGENGWAKINSINGIKTFQEFVVKYCGFKPLINSIVRKCTYQLISPYYQLFDSNWTPKIDYFVKFEHLDDFKKIVSEVFNVNNKCDYNQSVKRAGRHYKEFYTPELVSLVEKRYKKELTLFGYKFEMSELHPSDTIVKLNK
jgi:hypothetical protein